jgi:hypothetical protein
MVNRNSFSIPGHSDVATANAAATANATATADATIRLISAPISSLVHFLLPNV